MRHFLAWLLRSVFRYRAAVVWDNLRHAFPEKSEAEIGHIHKRFYTHLADIFCEMLWFGRCRGPKGRERLHRSHIVELTNPEELNRLYAAAPQLMLLQAHTGNWELIGGILEYSYGVPLDIKPDAFAVSYLRLHNPRADRFMARNRTAPVADLGFDGYVEAGDILRYAFRRKDRKFGYAFITDQYPYWAGKIRVNFMHRETPSMVAGAALAVKLDMAVGYLRFECREGGGYRMTVVPLCEHAGGQDPALLMKQYYKLLEEDLEKQPWNYLWTHKRWKE